MKIKSKVKAGPNNGNRGARRSPKRPCAPKSLKLR